MCTVVRNSLQGKSLTARSLNRSLHIIARAGRPDSIRRLELAGASRVVNPYLMAGHRMAEFAIHPDQDDRSMSGREGRTSPSPPDSDA